MTYTPDNTVPSTGSQPIKSNYQSDNTKSRPTTSPKTQKDFKKIMQGSDGLADEEDFTFGDLVDASDEDIADTSSKNPPSLFDLSSNKPPVGRQNPLPQASLFGSTATAGSHEKGDFDSAMEVTRGSKGTNKMKMSDDADLVDENARAAAETPSEAYIRLTSGKKDYSSGSFDLGSNSDQSASGQVTQAQDKDKITTRFSTEQTDLSYVNLIGATNPNATPVEINDTPKATMPASNIQEIVNQLVDKVTQIELNGKTETTVTLKQPPTLAGAQVVVTSFDSARGEFNISFENLTQAGKNLIDMRANQESLRQALDQKGYTVHIINTTTLVENRIYDTPPGQEGQQERREDQRQGGRQRQQQKNQENE